jgi:molecular chaperone DnaK (HSP70)
VGLTPRDIDTVLLAGGTTQIPVVRESVEKYFDAEPLAGHHPMQVVAIGASAFDPS